MSSWRLLKPKTPFELGLFLCAVVCAVLYFMSASSNFAIEQKLSNNGWQGDSPATQLITGDGIAGKLEINQVWAKRISDGELIRIPGSESDLCLDKQGNLLSLSIKSQDQRLSIVGLLPISSIEAERVVVHVHSQGSTLSLRVGNQTISKIAEAGTYQFDFTKSIIDQKLLAFGGKIEVFKPSSKYPYFLLGSIVLLTYFMGIKFGTTTSKLIYNYKSINLGLKYSFGSLLLILGILILFGASNIQKSVKNFEVANLRLQPEVGETSAHLSSNPDVLHKVESLRVEFTFDLNGASQRERDLILLSRGNQPGRVFIDQQNRLWVWIPFRDSESRWQAFSDGLESGRHSVIVDLQDSRTVSASVDGKSIGVMKWHTPLLGFQNGIEVDVMSKRADGLRWVSGQASYAEKYEGTYIGYRYGLNHFGIFIGAILTFLGFLQVCLKAVKKFVPKPTVSIDSPAFSIVFGVSSVLWLVSILQKFISFQAPISNSEYFATRNSPFVQSAPRFSDFYQLIQYANSSDPYTFAKSNYPPFTHLVFNWLSLLADPIAQVVLFAFALAIVFSIVFSLMNSEIFHRRIAFASILTLSYPALFAIDRGNIDLICVSGMLVGLLLAHRKQSVMAGIIFGILASIKIYPIFFAFCYLRQKGGLRTVLAAMSSMGILFGIGMEHYNLHSIFQIKDILSPTSTNLLSGSQISSWSTSIIGLILAIVLLFAPTNFTSAEQIFLKGIFPICLTFLQLGLIGISSISSLSLWKKHLLVAAGMLVLPLISFEYRAIILLIPLVTWMLNSKLEFEAPMNVHTKIISVTVGLLVGPTALYYFRGSSVSFSSIIVPIAVSLMTILLIQPQKGS